MEDITKIKSINKVIKVYFKQNGSVSIIAAKELMPQFIDAGIFTKDVKHGLPIRDILKALDKDNKLNLIPYVYVERKDSITSWSFIPSKEVIPEVVVSKKDSALIARAQSDETYVLDLCDTVLGKKSVRQKRFDFLLGDFHKDGKTRTKLPVGAFYKSLNLAIEHNEALTERFVASGKKTVSGVSHDEQRKIYNSRRASVLHRNGITCILFKAGDFSCDEKKRIIRNPEADLAVVTAKLKAFVK